MRANEPLAPKKLLDLQKWFGKRITRPLQNDESISLREGDLEEIDDRIAPSPTLTPKDRIEIYNQQYWWRLQNTMKDHFPGVLRLFGESNFIQLLATPFLDNYPSSHWDLNLLGFTFPRYLRKTYKEKDRALVIGIAELDLAYLELFFVKHPTPKKIQLSEEHFYVEKKKLASNVRLFSWPYDLYSFRKALLVQEANYWIKNPFPTLVKEETSFLLIQNSSLRIFAKKISSLEAKLLSHFKVSFSLEELCDRIEALDTKEQDEVEKNLQQWVKNWVQEGIVQEAIIRKGIIRAARKPFLPSKKVLKQAYSSTKL